MPATAACAASPRSAVYHRRRPERTLLYRTVQTHLATWLALQDDGAGATAPAVTEREFRRYLECGILAHGFARARCADCGHDFLVAYSCKGRGVCPSCNTRRMVETAAHLADHVIPRLPVRQWVLSVPKRLRYHLERDPAIQNAALRIFLNAIERTLRQCSPGASATSQLGAVVFIHRFGALLNAHLHFHCIVVDGVFDAAADDGVTFHLATGLDAQAISAVQASVRGRLLRAAERRGLLAAEDAQAMAAWEHGGGFSVDAEVRIEAQERDALERLLRYCARPAFALERLREIDPEHLVYESVKPGPGGSVSVILTPMQLLDRLAALIPPPRRHRHRYVGVLAPNSPLRAAVTALAQSANDVADPVADDPVVCSGPGSTSEATDEPHRKAARYAWALLLARIYEVLPLLCPMCGGQMRIIAFITEGTAIREILDHLGEPISPPRLAPARGPPLWDLPSGESGDIDPQAQPAPDYEFDQRIAW
jgi:hypothetical protein